MRAVIECEMDSPLSHCSDLFGSGADYFPEIALLHRCCHAREELGNALKKETSHRHTSLPADTMRKNGALDLLPQYGRTGRWMGNVYVVIIYLLLRSSEISSDVPGMP